METGRGPHKTRRRIKDAPRSRAKKQRIEKTFEEVLEDIPESIPENISEDISEDIWADIWEDISEDILVDVPEDISEDSSEDVLEYESEDISEDILKDILENIPADEFREQGSQKITKEITKDISKDAPKKGPAKRRIKDTSQAGIRNSISKDLRKDRPESPGGMRQGDYEQARYRARLRERRRRRRRMLKIRRAVVLGILLALVILFVSLIVVSCRYIMKKAGGPDEESVKLLNQYYADFIKDTGQGAKKSKEKQEKEFSEWMLETCGEENWEEITERLKEEKLKEADFYEITGKTLHVLSDMYEGRLADDKTAAEHHIYQRDGAEKGKASLVFAGDVCLEEEDFVLGYYDEVQDLEKCISPEILERTNSADVFLLNHEYCISDRGEALEGKYYTFRADPKRMKLIEEMGTDIVSLANNHVYDYGPEALLDTADLLDEAGIAYVGGGRNLDEAKQPVYFIVNGVKIGYVAASRAEKTRYTPQAEEDEPGVLLMYESDEFVEVIKNASKECDYLAAYVHWGTEDSNQFEDYQHEQAEELLSSGADIIIGGHPHVLQGIEYIDGKPVVYSMGDFWFNDETKYNGLLELKISGEGLLELSFVPCQQEEYTTKYLSEQEDQRELFDYLEELSKGVKIGDDGVIREEEKSE